MAFTPSRLVGEGWEERDQLKVSVVVPTYNRRESLARLLTGLTEQTYPARQFEVVLVDDGSTDGTVEMANRFDAPYDLRVLQQKHSGPAEARNRGVSEARGGLIVFLDDDVLPSNDLLDAHVDAHAGRANLVLIGPMLPPGDFPRAPWVRWEEELLQKQYHELVMGAYACTPRQFYTGNASLQRACFLEAGGFDPRFRRAEDVELAYRLRNRAAAFAFEPNAQVLHYASRTFEAWCRTPYLYGRYDVAMDRNQDQEAWACATHEFHERHPLTRLVTRLCVGHPGRIHAATAVLRFGALAADHLGAWRPTVLMLSALFNVLYWQGAADELGGPEPVWRAVAASAPVPA
jgi:GT2 family glycosyltransferase